MLKNTYYHVSNNKKLTHLTPKIPENAVEGFEELETKRVCVAESVENCLRAIMPADNEKLYVYQVISNKKPYKPFIYQVTDCKETGEFWFLEDVKVRLVGKIKIITEISKKEVKNYKKRSGFWVRDYSYEWLEGGQRYENVN